MSSPPIPFGLIGHQDSWESVERLFSILRPCAAGLSAEVRGMYAFVPPRKLFDVHVRSFVSGMEADGCYIETFISPDELDERHLRKNIDKVKAAAVIAAREKALVTGLGGFSSIVLEGKVSSLEKVDAVFTTGNTLTAALVVKSVEAASLALNIDLGGCNVLILGATGDIGSACAEYFALKAGRLLLCARNRGRLGMFAESFVHRGIACIFSDDAASLLPLADVVVCTASSFGFGALQSLLKPSALVCDAGYPKNFMLAEPLAGLHYYYGGLGKIDGQVDFSPCGYQKAYPFFHFNAAHGCLLESVVLALEGRAEAYSAGRGRIGLNAIEEMWNLAQRHGIGLAPFINNLGPWADQPEGQHKK